MPVCITIPLSPISLAPIRGITAVASGDVSGTGGTALRRDHTGLHTAELHNRVTGLLPVAFLELR